MLRAKQIVGFMPIFQAFDEYFFDTKTQINIMPGITQILTPQNMEDIFDNFPETSGSLQDKGVVMDFDMLFFMNHIYENDNDEPPIYHYSLSATIKATAIILRDAAERKFWHQFRVINEQGTWIRYDSDQRDFYKGILSNGTLDFNADPSPISVSFAQSGGLPGATPSLIVNNNLRNYGGGFPATPNYPLNLKMKVKAREFSLDDHTYENIN